MRRTNLLLSVLACVTLMGCNGNKGSTKEKLYVGLECNYAPFNWTENKQSDTNYSINNTQTYAEGYDVQIAKRIADELNMELVIEKLDWDGLIPSVLESKIDLIIAGMSPTESRKIDIDFTNPYYTSEHVLLVNSDSQYANITSVNELSGAIIAGQIGTLYDDIAHAIPNVNADAKAGKYDKKSVPELVTALQSDIIDGTVLELPVAQGLVAANKDLAMVRFAEGQGFTELIDDETNELRAIEDTDRDVSIGIAKGRDELKNNINNILAGISSETRTQMMQDAVIRQENA